MNKFPRPSFPSRRESSGGIQALDSHLRGNGESGEALDSHFRGNDAGGR